MQITREEIQEALRQADKIDWDEFERSMREGCERIHREGCERFNRELDAFIEAETKIVLPEPEPGRVPWSTEVWLCIGILFGLLSGITWRGAWQAGFTPTAICLAIIAQSLLGCGLFYCMIRDAVEAPPEVEL